MKEIQADKITETVARLCVEANHRLPPDVEKAVRSAEKEEPWPAAKGILKDICRNIDIAAEGVYPLCQDTGMACVFLEVGQELHIVGGGLYEAVQQGVRRGYTEGYLRKSVVADPLRRKNTNDNTPALITTDIISGEELHITVAPKGFGSENMSRLAMLKPSDGLAGVKRFVIETAQLAGSNPCPPVVMGVGIGGSFDKAALLAKRAMLRPLDSCNPDPYYAMLENELLQSVNALGIGPQGFGGKTTALKINIEAMPTHIAGLPVAANVNCHVTRRATAVL